MKIAILGKVNLDYPYLEWKEKLEVNVDLTQVSLINIVVGNGTLNQYVRRYATYNNIPVKEYAADYKTYGDDARLIRNRTLVGDSDMVVGFIPGGSSEESWIFRPGIDRQIKAIVIECSFKKFLSKVSLWGHLFPHESGLPIETYVSKNHTSTLPLFYVGEYGCDAVLLIDDTPKLIHGHIEENISDKIVEFIKANRDTLLKYWSGEYNTSALFTNLITMEMIKNPKI